MLTSERVGFGLVGHTGGPPTASVFVQWGSVRWLRVPKKLEP